LLLELVLLLLLLTHEGEAHFNILNGVVCMAVGAGQSCKLIKFCRIQRLQPEGKEAKRRYGYTAARGKLSAWQKGKWPAWQKGKWLHGEKETGCMTAPAWRQEGRGLQSCPSPEGSLLELQRVINKGCSP